jgi:serine/threonine protein kinase
LTIADESIIRSDAHAYRVLRMLGEGGQTRARLVEREDEPGTPLVLKLLRMEHVDDWKQVELFERQVSTMAALDHPGIPRLLDRIVEDGRTAGIVETFVEGHTVAQQIAEHGPVSPERFERILRDGLEILAYLHRQVPPVVHRDINPKNVMLGPDRAWIIDFGSVRVGGKTDMTSVGTFGYMPPEQIMGRAKPASDMYGLGMTMVSLAERRDVGDLPVDASTGQVDPQQLLTSVEPRVRDVVLAMILPGLAERLSDPSLALQRLDATHLPVRVEPREVATASKSRTTRIVTAAVIGVTLVTLYAVMYRATPERDTRVTAEREEAPRPPAVPVIAVEPPRATPPHVDAPPPQIDPAPPSEDGVAKLMITSEPSGVKARIDDTTECTTPCGAVVTFGKHTLTLEWKGQNVERKIQVLEDTKMHIALER